MHLQLIIGLALILAGGVGLVLEHAVFDGAAEIIDAGSIKVLARTGRFFPITTLASVFALAAGLALLVLGRPRGGSGAAE